MERLQCKACGCYSMIPMDVAIESEEFDLLGGDQESRFYTCHVCGDNWLSVKEAGTQGKAQITFIHQMGMEPVLKRIVRTQAPQLITESSEGGWQYFADDREIDEEEWREQLIGRRRILKSVCCN
jgi:hypothetical protein